MTMRFSDPRADQVGTPQHEMKQRWFLPRQHETLLKTLHSALHPSSDHGLPEVFKLPYAVPLKPGSETELAVRFEVPADRSDPQRMSFDSAMTLYFGSSQYGHALMTCDTLFSIGMDPAGPPGAAEREQGRVLTWTPAGAEQRITPRRGRNGGDLDADAPRGSGRHRPPAFNRCRFEADDLDLIRDLFLFALDVRGTFDLPAFLWEDIAIPLKGGFAGDLARRYAVPRHGIETPPARAFGKAVKLYIQSRPYRHALLAFETRFTIDMKPVGVISTLDRNVARATLRGMGAHNMPYPEDGERTDR